MLVRLGYIHSSIEIGIKKSFIWNTEKTPHLLISGITGGGKTVCSQLIVNQLLENKADIFIADFKAGGDWNNIVDKYGEYIGCDEILNSFYNSFTETIKNKGHAEKYLIFDEVSSYTLSKDNKAFKEVMSKISHIAFMGRSFGYHLIFIAQQFNAKVLDTAIREQFGIKIFMGQVISTESATMLFTGCEIDKSIRLPAQCGYISTPERELDVIQIPYISKPEKLKKLLIMKGKKLL